MAHFALQQMVCGLSMLADPNPEGSRMDQTVAKPADQPHQPRKLSREARKAQLIDATIEVIAVRGYARTTLTDVANQGRPVAWAGELSLPVEGKASGGNAAVSGR
jgi:hypothetical protein